MARLHPGVYVEEVPGGARAIEAASTSCAIFVGETERGPLEPLKIKNWSDYQRAFGGYLKHTAASTDRLTLPDAVLAFFSNGGQNAWVLRVVDSNAPTASTRQVSGTTFVRAASPGVWGNRLKVFFLEPSSGAAADRLRIVVAYNDPFTGRDAIVEDFDRLSLNKADRDGYVVDVLKRSAFVRWDEAAVTVPTKNSAEPKLSADAILALSGAELSGGTGGTAAPAATQYETALLRLDEVTDASLLLTPGKTGDVRAKAAAYVIARPLQDLFYIADLDPAATAATASLATTEVKADFQDATAVKSDFIGYYWPWIQVPDPVGGGSDPTRFVPPSGYVAGVFARTDARRGVWKAPAGLEAGVLGIRALQHRILDTHQDDLNPLGINALRVMPSAGAVIWGARTSRPDTEWRYIPVRRTAMFLRKSIYDGIQWAVFEPNDEPLWASLRATVGGFMDGLYRQGAFAGKTARDSYFVKCDPETTTPDDQAAGVVNLWVGFAPVRPAEFVVVKLRQMTVQKS